MKNIMKDLDHYAAAFQSYQEAPLRNRQGEVALLSKTVKMIQNLREVCVFMCAWVREWERRSDHSRQEMRKHLGKSHAGAAWPKLPRFLQSCSPSEEEEDSFSSKVMLSWCFRSSGRSGGGVGGGCFLTESVAVVSSRGALPRCGALTPTTTDRRCARWWGAFTPGPSPSTGPWATSAQESTGNDGRPGFDNFPWSSATVA